MRTYFSVLAEYLSPFTVTWMVPHDHSGGFLLLFFMFEVLFTVQCGQFHWPLHGHSGWIFSFGWTIPLDFGFLFACFVFLPCAKLCSVSYGDQRATIWTVNVVSVTTKLFHILLAPRFLHHERHYHYRWCSILFWSLDSRLCLIKNKIYGAVQSAASVVCRASSSPCVVTAVIKPYKCKFQP